MINYKQDYFKSINQALVKIDYLNVLDKNTMGSQDKILKPDFMYVLACLKKNHTYTFKRDILSNPHPTVLHQLVMSGLIKVVHTTVFPMRIITYKLTNVGQQYVNQNLPTVKVIKRHKMKLTTVHRFISDYIFNLAGALVAVAFCLAIIKMGAPHVPLSQLLIIPTIVPFVSTFMDDQSINWNVNKGLPMYNVRQCKKLLKICRPTEYNFLIMKIRHPEHTSKYPYNLIPQELNNTMFK